MNERPRPPERLLGHEGAYTERPFEPARDLWPWAKATFVEEGAPLANEEHAHLREAEIGFLWCSIPNARQMNAVVGMAELPVVQGGRWARARFEQQLTGWFGLVPDFLITLDAGFADQASDATFCAVVEHELLHCGQERDIYGAPKFTKEGAPKLGIRGHDVEEFVSIVERYGVGASAGRTADLVAAAKRKPLICSADIASVCGTCRR